MKTLFTYDTFSILRTYLVQTEFSCNHYANKLTKFIKKIEKSQMSF
jgi:hypothetical protein